MRSGLVVENLNYKDKLKNININLKPGEINVLMGKSGSGKTLLLKSIFGLIDTKGSITYNETILTKENINNIRKNFGICLGLNALENKNVFENLIDPLINLNYDIDTAKKKVYNISKKIGIDNLLYKEIDTLSHSQKKIISFIQSIIHEPKVILIDNLFDSMDIYNKDRIIKYLRQLKKSIVIFTTNNSEDLCFADNLIIMKNGKIIDYKEVKELIEEENKFTKNDIKLPFLIDLSYKLKSYELIDRLIYDYEEMVDEVWQ